MLLNHYKIQVSTKGCKIVLRMNMDHEFTEKENS